MLKKELIDTDRVRKIDGPFGWIPRKFITDGYIMMLTPDELALYLFLIGVGDRQGMSFYGDRRISELLSMGLGSLQDTRQKLQERSLIAYKEPLYQVLSLPYIQ